MCDSKNSGAAYKRGAAQKHLRAFSARVEFIRGKKQYTDSEPRHACPQQMLRNVSLSRKAQMAQRKKATSIATRLRSKFCFVVAVPELLLQSGIEKPEHFGLFEQRMIAVRRRQSPKDTANSPPHLTTEIPHRSEELASKLNDKKAGCSGSTPAW
jgi:hypothetical protein